MDKSPTLERMAAALSHVKPAARLQITAVGTMMSELQAGLRQCGEATLVASNGVGGDNLEARPSRFQRPSTQMLPPSALLCHVTR